MNTTLRNASLALLASSVLTLAACASTNDDGMMTQPAESIESSPQDDASMTPPPPTDRTTMPPTEDTTPPADSGTP